jgi:hypothetical protein
VIGTLVKALGNITVVAVTVERNLFAPVLQGQTVVTIRVPETKELGVPIATISANDADSQVISMCSHQNTCKIPDTLLL